MKPNPGNNDIGHIGWYFFFFFVLFELILKCVWVWNGTGSKDLSILMLNLNVFVAWKLLHNLVKKIKQWKSSFKSVSHSLQQTLTKRHLKAKMSLFNLLGFFSILCLWYLIFDLCPLFHLGGFQKHITLLANELWEWKKMIYFFLISHKKPGTTS